MPEACTSPNVYSRRCSALPARSTVSRSSCITRLARELDCIVAGGFLSVRGKHTYGTFVMAEPDGSVHLHDKDIPTAWEQHYYVGGDDRGVVELQHARVQGRPDVGLGMGAHTARPSASGRTVCSWSWAACAGRRFR